MNYVHSQFTIQLIVPFYVIQLLEVLEHLLELNVFSLHHMLLDLVPVVSYHNLHSWFKLLFYFCSLLYKPRHFVTNCHVA